MRLGCCTGVVARTEQRNSSWQAPSKCKTPRAPSACSSKCALPQARTSAFAITTRRSASPAPTRTACGPWLPPRTGAATTSRRPLHRPARALRGRCHEQTNKQPSCIGAEIISLGARQHVGAVQGSMGRDRSWTQLAVSLVQVSHRTAPLLWRAAAVLSGFATIRLGTSPVPGLSPLRCLARLPRCHRTAGHAWTPRATPTLEHLPLGVPGA